MMMGGSPKRIDVLVCVYPTTHGPSDDGKLMCKPTMVCKKPIDIGVLAHGLSKTSLVAAGVKKLSHRWYGSDEIMGLVEDREPLSKDGPGCFKC